MIRVTCTNCGGTVSTTENEFIVKCDFCDTQFLLEHSIHFNQNKPKSCNLPKKSIETNIPNIVCHKLCKITEDNISTQPMLSINMEALKKILGSIISIGVFIGCLILMTMYKEFWLVISTITIIFVIPVVLHFIVPKEYKDC